jgi:hypothetical protein
MPAPRLSALTASALVVAGGAGQNPHLTFATSCPKLDVLGYQESSNTSVSLHVKRVR